MAEILLLFDVCLSVCVCVSVHSGPVNQTSVNRLKLRTSKLFRKGAWWGHATPKFSGVKCYSCKTVKAMDFRFDVHVPKDSLDMTA